MKKPVLEPLQPGPTPHRSFYKGLTRSVAIAFLIKVTIVIMAGMFVFDAAHRLVVTPRVMENHLMG